MVIGTVKDKMTREELGLIQVGDRLIRVLAGKEIPVIVTDKKNAIITVGNNDPQEKNKISSAFQMLKDRGIVSGSEMNWDDVRPTWQFSANTGGEIDTDLGYDGINTCSYLKLST